MSSTIAAIATAAGNSGIGIIRISGENAIDVADKVFRFPSGNNSLKNVKSHTIHYGHIYDNDKIIDEVLLSVFLAPKSFTAENTVEINCHGGSFVLSKILEIVLKNGAVIAEPGEFTKRAFLNGRIDLSQAEAVIDIINSKNSFSLENSIKQLSGRLLIKIEGMRDKLLNEIAFIESALDDPEHYSIDEHRDDMLLIIKNILSELNEAIANSYNGQLLKDGINTLILGKPNAGKSSLLNLMVGYERAIVTDIAGTTRDTIEEKVNIDDITLNLIDTAGIRNTSDIVEKIGVDKALSDIERANLIIFVVDSTVPLDDNDIKILDSIKGRKTIILNNKCDLKDSNNSSIREFIGDDFKNTNILDFSALTGDGLDELSSVIKSMFLAGDIKFDEDIFVTNIRQRQHLIDAKNSLSLVVDGINDFMPEDCLTIDMMDAYKALGFVLGKEIADDLADRIFAKFCMGK